MISQQNKSNDNRTKQDLTAYLPPADYRVFCERACKKMITFIGLHRTFNDIYHCVKLPKDAQILIIGETGTGKELVVDLIHELTNTEKKTEKEYPLVKVNCGLISKDLAVSELFGHKKGSFTGAIADHEGKFMQANGGTIFLDEIQALSPEAQGTLLRAIEDRWITKFGDKASNSIKLDVRIILATNKRLTGDEAFRFDLYNKIKRNIIYIPPLKRRFADIPALVKHFITENNKSLKKKIRFIDFPVLLFCFWYPWPGNVRELGSFLEYNCQRETGEVLTFDPLLSFFSDYELNLESPPELRFLELFGFNLNEMSLFFLPNLLWTELEKKDQLAKVAKIKGKYEDQLPNYMKKKPLRIPHPSFWYEPIPLDTLFDDSFRDAMITEILHEEKSKKQMQDVKKFSDWLGRIFDLVEEMKKEIKAGLPKQQEDILSLSYKYKDAEDMFCKLYLTELITKYGWNKKMVQEHTGMSMDWLDKKIKKHKLFKPSHRQKSENN